MILKPGLTPIIMFFLLSNYSASGPSAVLFLLQLKPHLLLLLLHLYVYGRREKISLLHRGPIHHIYQRYFIQVNKAPSLIAASFAHCKIIIALSLCRQQTGCVESGSR
jgi:hypothetical protein